MFTDVWLFDRLLGPQGEEADPALVATWLERLQMAHKLQLENGKIADLRLSKGQKKRVALLLALAESRDIILLDEWAADQIRISAASSTSPAAADAADGQNRVRHQP